jgi:hypothetical protein
MALHAHRETYHCAGKSTWHVPPRSELIIGNLSTTRLTKLNHGEVEGMA